MEYQELVHDFVDGLLDHEKEILLFQELVHNDALRDELKFLYHLKTASHNDVASFAPPEASNNALFKRLGFAVSDESAALIAQQATQHVKEELAKHVTKNAVKIAVITPFFLKLVEALKSATTQLFTQNLSQYSLVAASALFASALTSTVWMVWSGNQTGSVNATTPSSATQTTNTVVSARPSTSTASQENRQKDGREVGQDNKQQNTDARHMMLDNNGNITAKMGGMNGQSGDGFASTRATTLPSASFAALMMPDEYDPKHIMEAGDRPLPALHTEHTKDEQKTPEFLFSVSIRALETLALKPVPSELTGAANILANKAINVSYRLNEEQEIGIEIGAERFYQQFTLSSRQDGRVLETTQYQQNPLLLWVGATFRQQFDEIVYGVKPFVGATVGASQGGGIGRASIGLLYTPLPTVSLLVNVEGATLLYQADNVWYTSPKIGLSYGLVIRF
jgi:hypothetical protein